jgi:hypothetical protein
LPSLPEAPNATLAMQDPVFRVGICMAVSISVFLEALMRCFYSTNNWLLLAWTMEILCMKTCAKIEESSILQLILYFICLAAKLCYLILIISENSYKMKESGTGFLDYFNDTLDISGERESNDSIGFAISVCFFLMANTTILFFDMTCMEKSFATVFLYNFMVGVEGVSITCILLMMQNMPECFERYSPKERHVLFVCSIVQIIICTSPILEFFILSAFRHFSTQNVHPSPIRRLPLPDVENRENVITGPQLESRPVAVLGPALEVNESST